MMVTRFSAVGSVSVALCCLLLLVGLCASAGAAADTQPVDSTRTPCGLHPGRLAALGAVGGGLHYVGFRYFDKTWYQGQKQDHIRWIYDWSGDTYLNLDKGGHFMGGMVMAQSIQDGLVWGGVSRRTSAIRSARLAGIVGSGWWWGKVPSTAVWSR